MQPKTSSVPACARTSSGGDSALCFARFAFISGRAAAILAPTEAREGPTRPDRQSSSAFLVMS